MAIVIRNEGAKINSSINVTPMVDVMLVLLIIFMVITPMLRPEGAPIDLARTSNAIRMPDADKADALIVSVMRDGKVFLGSEIVTTQNLAQRLQDKLSVRANKTVYVRADARARYGTLVNAVDDLRSAGVDQLGLLTEQRSFVPSAAREPYSQKKL
jgi:biopolymer transport protein ExbD/biopolymer transport protein TolR